MAIDDDIVPGSGLGSGAGKSVNQTWDRLQDDQTDMQDQDTLDEGDDLDEPEDEDDDLDIEEDVAEDEDGDEDEAETREGMLDDPTGARGTMRESDLMPDDEDIGGGGRGSY